MVRVDEVRAFGLYHNGTRGQIANSANVATSPQMGQLRHGAGWMKPRLHPQVQKQDFHLKQQDINDHTLSHCYSDSKRKGKDSG